MPSQGEHIGDTMLIIQFLVTLCIVVILVYLVAMWLELCVHLLMRGRTAWFVIAIAIPVSVVLMTRY